MLSLFDHPMHLLAMYQNFFKTDGLYFHYIGDSISNSSSDVSVLFDALKRTLHSGGLTGRSEKPAPSPACLTGPDPHAGSNTDHERQEEPEESYFETSSSIDRTWCAVLGSAAVQCGQQRQLPPSRPH